MLAFENEGTAVNVPPVLISLSISFLSVDGFWGSLPVLSTTDILALLSHIDMLVE